MIRKYHNHKLQTNPWHREEEPHKNHETPGRQTKQSNQLSLPHQDDCKTRRGIMLRTTKHRMITDNKERLQTPTMGVIINNNYSNNNSTTALERTAAKPAGGLNAIYWYKIFDLVSADVEKQEMFSSHGSLLTIAMYHHGKTL